ncbi:type II toxin-antitoxin system Phd/YefM family antitoxin [Corynebacterium sp. AOP40-9SA-29]|uniref:type II toxin-antitoxin system Phd/YefM family antitoxin n=1 Tax=Corynebacterium sp. AOP40-9SA-29 TaxID=3457677 RepID=UPI0040343AB5
MATVPATEFNRSPSQIKRLTADGPVIVTERERPTLVVLSYEDYERITATPSGLGTWLQMDEDTDLDIDDVSADYEFGIRPVEFE